VRVGEGHSALSRVHPVTLSPFLPFAPSAWPLTLFESDNSSTSDRVPFSHQERGFEVRIPAVAADAPACGDDTVVGQSGLSRFPQDVTDRACGARPSRQSRDVSVGRHAASRNLAQQAQHTAGKRSHFLAAQ
jgi:hypothetical protein